MVRINKNFNVIKYQIYTQVILLRNIEELTKEVNSMNLEMEDMNLENEEMRERLGIGSREELDVQNIRKKKVVKEEQAASLNRVLQKEVISLGKTL